MTDFAQDRPAMRARGPSLPKLNLLPASHFLQQQHPQHFVQHQHPFDTTSATDAGIDIDMDMDMDFDTTPPVFDNKNEPTTTAAAASGAGTRPPFVSAHPSPDVSDESDCERGLGHEADDSSSCAASSAPFDSPLFVPPSAKQLERDQARRRPSHIPFEENPLSHHLFLAPVPIPSSSSSLSRTPPHSPLYYRKRPSFSMNTPPSSAHSVMPAPCSDSAAVEALIREHVHANMLSHATDKAFFWHLGKLSEFSFSDRFVRSRVFEIKDNNATPDLATVVAVNINPTSTEAPDMPVSPNQQALNSWRLRLYPHGRGDRHRDSEYIGLYIQQEVARAAMDRRRSSAITTMAAANFSCSAPTPFLGRGSISSSTSSAPRRSISGASTLPAVRRHVTLFMATENGDCLAKQDLIEWFSGSEGGLGFPRMVSRKTVQDAVKSCAMIDDEEENSEIGIVAGVIFHEL